MSRRLSRRTFLQTTALTLAPALSRADEPKLPASDRLRVGVIGLAGQGKYNWGQVSKAGAEIVALCDVDENRAGDARERFPKATFDVDFRRMLDRKGLDAVVVATPDHTHAVAAVAALKAGLHVYCEKPLAHTVHEARVITKTAARHKRVTQLGTQIHAQPNYRRVVELVQSGAVGAVREVHVWVGKVWGGTARPKETPPVPTGLHYDLWQGPVRDRPYHPSHVHYSWRVWWDYGGGTLADFGCHFLDLPFWALKLHHPSTVAAEGPPVHPDGTPEWLIVRYEFPARGEQPPVKLTWYHGDKRPKVLPEAEREAYGNGVLFVGDKGQLLADYGKHKLLPEEKFAGFVRPKPFIPDSKGHHREWVEACKTGGETTCPFSYGGPLTEAALLGNVAYRLGRPLTWDFDSLRAINEPEADRFLRKEYRKPWSL
jgi:predicted dehydrogenase